MAELADALDSKSSARKGVEVQVLSPVLACRVGAALSNEELLAPGALEMSTDPDRKRLPVGYQLRFGPGGRERAQDVANGLPMPAIVVEDANLAPEDVALDVSFEDGEVQTDVDPQQYLD